MCQKLIDIFDTLSIPLDWLIGQSYDGAGNVRGKYSGLQARITQIAPKALYIWCRAHHLNLVIENVLSCSTEMRNAIGLMGELCTFFNGHKRHAVLMDMQKDERYTRTLKRVADTTLSWRSGRRCKHTHGMFQLCRWGPGRATTSGQ